MNRPALYGLGAVAALLAAYYVIPIAIAVASLGEICPYSPLGINLCGGTTTKTNANEPFLLTGVGVEETTIEESVATQTETQVLPGTIADPSAFKLCLRDGIRYEGTTPEGAEVCFTLSPDGKELIETAFSFVRKSDCPKFALGTTHSGFTGDLDPSGHVVNPDGFTATVRGATASGEFTDSDICPGKTFKWIARRKR
jgi:hypothetical protein